MFMQVTVVYKNVKGRMVPVRVHTIVISTMHTETYVNEAGEAVPLTQEIIAEQLKEHVRSFYRALSHNMMPRGISLQDTQRPL